MRNHRLYTDQPLKSGAEVALYGQPAHYLHRVLRLAEGSEIALFNGDGHDYRCSIVGATKGGVRVKVLEQCPNGAESPLRITLCQSLSRGERMDYSLQKATELGVAAVQLLLSERVELKLAGDRLEKRMAHWRGVMASACEQCGRAVVPELRAPIALHEWTAPDGTRLVLDAGADRTLSQVPLRGEVEIAIGPEGGFSESELEAMKQGGVTAVRLGPRILRTETAGPAAIAVLQFLSGDFA